MSNRKKPARMWTPDEKHQFVHMVRLSDRTRQDILHEYGIGRRTFWDWEQRHWVGPGECRYLPQKEIWLSERGNGSKQLRRWRELDAALGNTPMSFKEADRTAAFGRVGYSEPDFEVG